MLFCNDFHFSCKRLEVHRVIFYERGGMKKTNKNIFLFFDPVTRVLAHGNGKVIVLHTSCVCILKTDPWLVLLS